MNTVSSQAEKIKESAEMYEMRKMLGVLSGI